MLQAWICHVWLLEWVKEGGDLPAPSPKSHMVPKGSLKRGVYAGTEKREHHYHTKNLPVLHKTWEEALSVSERWCQPPINNSALGLVPPDLSCRWSTCCIFTTAQIKKKNKHPHQATGQKLPLSFVPVRWYLIAVVFQLTWLSCCPLEYPSYPLWFQQLPRIFFFPHQKFPFSLSSHNEKPYLKANQRIMPHPNSRAFF